MKLNENLQNIVLLILSVCITVAVVEIGLGFMPKEQVPIMRENPSGTGSYRMLPNFKYHKSFSEFDVSIETNRHGMRWRDVSIDKKEGQVRVVFLGDSFTFGEWADSIENSFVGIVDQLLGSDTVEIINFGIGGMGFDDYESLLKENVLQFNPDILVIAPFVGNDFRDTYLGSEKYVIKDHTLVWRDKYGKLPPEFHPQQGNRFKRMIKSSNIYTAIRPLLVSYLLPDQNPIRFGKNMDFYTFPFWSQVPLPDVAIKAVDKTIQHLAAIKSICDDAGIQLVITPIPFYDQVYATALEGDDFRVTQPQEFFESFAKTHNIAYFSVLDPLRRIAVENPNEKLYLSRDPHFNTKGHVATGKLLATYLQDVILDSQKPTTSSALSGHRQDSQ